MANLKPLAEDLVDDLLLANKILFHFGIVDAFGHVSVRHDADPEKYVMSRHLAPGLVTKSDLLTYDLDSVPVEPAEHRLYSERFIHGEIYKVRPDVKSVVHCHAPALLPFATTKTDLHPIYHVSAFLGLGVSRFEIRDKFGPATDMLVRSAPIGAALAEKLADKPMVLMRGHGATMVGATIRLAVYRAMYAVQNAQIQLEAMRLGDVDYLTPQEADVQERYTAEVVHRPWNLWVREVGEK